MPLSLRSTSTRTFVVIPLVVLIEQRHARRIVARGGVPMMAIGFLLYRLGGRYRIRRAGGPPGMKGMPDHLLTDGIYAWTRNPMYLGHQLFLFGLALSTRSPIAAVVVVVHQPWFAERVRRDERRLLAAFGSEYAEYAGRVSRWLPTGPGSRHLWWK